MRNPKGLRHSIRKPENNIYLRRIYEADLEDIQQSQERIWTAAEKIVSSLAALK